MTTIVHQLDPPIPLLTPLGTAQAHFLVYAFENDILYGVFQDDTGENWWWRNHQVRLQTSLTQGRYWTTPITPVDGLEPHVLRAARPASGKET